MLKVLIVDDEVGQRTLLQILIRRLGHQPLVAEDGSEGLRMAQDEQPHLVILDHQMPGMTGGEVCLALKSHPACKHILVLMYSASNQPDWVEEWRQNGADAVIVKPCLPRTLIEVIERLLERASSTDHNPHLPATRRYSPSVPDHCGPE